jgi:sugar/nucleoside kinase (ribokinase family)
VVDPTGCGDAYRAGLRHITGRDWRTTGQLADGSAKVSSRGGEMADRKEMRHENILEPTSDRNDHDQKRSSLSRRRDHD